MNAEGIVEHFRSERNELRLKLQTTEEALQAEKGKVTVLQADAEASQKRFERLEEENRRLREELQAEREGPQPLKHANGNAQLTGVNGIAKDHPIPSAVAVDATGQVGLSSIPTGNSISQPALLEVPRACSEDSVAHALDPVEVSAPAQEDQCSSVGAVSQPSQPQASATSKRRLDDDLFQDGLPSKRARTNESPSVTPHPETQQQPDVSPVENVERKEEEEEEDNISGGQMSKLLIADEENVASKLASHLSECKALTISPTPSCPFVTPHFIKMTYNPKISHKCYRIISGTQFSTSSSGPQSDKRMVWPVAIKNPMMPQEPGEPGLLFFSANEMVPTAPVSLLYVPYDPARRGASEPGRYLGDYEYEPICDMSAECFAAQGDKTKKEWALLFLKRGSQDSVQFRARIALRKRGIIQGKDMEQYKKEVNAEAAAASAGKGHPIDIDDIIKALSSGDESTSIHIVRIKCVGYDHVFADDMKAKWTLYQAKQKK